MPQTLSDGGSVFTKSCISPVRDELWPSGHNMQAVDMAFCDMYRYESLLIVIPQLATVQYQYVKTAVIGLLILHATDDTAVPYCTPADDGANTAFAASCATCCRSAPIHLLYPVGTLLEQY
jgi:hypothetical protein